MYRLNHFPGMHSICRKTGLARNLSRMQAVFPKEYYFFPKTWVLPCDFSDFKSQFDKRKGAKTFIVKPDNSCQGNGIFLTRSWESIDPTLVQVAQRYLHKPLTIDGYKFDLRVISCGRSGHCDYFCAAGLCACAFCNTFEDLVVQRWTNTHLYRKVQ